jgi:hypothetical protein
VSADLDRVPLRIDVGDDHLRGGGLAALLSSTKPMWRRPGPLVGLFGQRCADQPDDRHLVREDPHDVGAPPISYPINRRS